MRRADNLGRWLRAHRLSFKDTPAYWTQSMMAGEMGEGWSQSLFSKIEGGRANFHSPDWPGRRVYELLLGYRVTSPTQMLELADMFSLARLTEYLAERNTHAVGEGQRVKHLGRIQAGKIGESGSDPIRMVSVPDFIADRYRLEDVFAVDVNGESMLSADARSCIPPGSMVFFHGKLRPEPGEIVCVYLAAHDQTVVKKWHPGERHAVLTSTNPEHAPIVVTDEDDGVLQGVYLTHIPKPHRLR